MVCCLRDKGGDTVMSDAERTPHAPPATSAQKDALRLMFSYEARLLREDRWVDHPHGICSGPTETDGGQPFVNFATARALERRGWVKCIWDGENSACELTGDGRFVAHYFVQALKSPLGAAARRADERRQGTLAHE